MALQQLIVSLGFVFIQRAVNSYGEAMTASYFPILGLFQGANHSLYSTFVATGALTIRVISTYVLQEIPAISYRMVWWNTLFGWGLGFILTWVHFFREKWKRNVGSHVVNSAADHP